ncbi:MAG: LptF/LptG family permease [Verrucomicrobia bacterium]|nr:LptF/LptG family permease [Verrucomicrobiota bacterium]
MPTLHLYLLRQTLATCLLTVATFTLVLLLGNVLKQVFDLIAVGVLTPGSALQAILLLIPFALSFALPIGMLTASLLTFSRLSVDQELTAIRAGGISLVAAITPVLVLAAVLTGVSATLNMVVAPRCRVAFNDLVDGLLRRNPTSFISEGRYVSLGNLTLYAQEVRGNVLKDLLIYGTTNAVENGVTNRVRNLDAWAPSAEVLVGTNGYPEEILLRDLLGLQFMDGEWRSGYFAEHRVPIRGLQPSDRRKPKLSVMTFAQLREELALRRSQGAPDGPVLVHLHKQVAFAFACLAFPLVGIPLGIRMHRRETNIGVAVALLLLALYYSFVILGHAFETRAQYHPHLFFWIPNIAFQVIGMTLIWRANRG